MKKMILGTIACLAMLLMTSCGTQQEVVKFEEVRHYFYRNDAPEGEQLLKLTSQDEFDHYNRTPFF